MDTDTCPDTEWTQTRVRTQSGHVHQDVLRDSRDTCRDACRCYFSRLLPRLWSRGDWCCGADALCGLPPRWRAWRRGGLSIEDMEGLGGGWGGGAAGACGLRGEGGGGHVQAFDMALVVLNEAPMKPVTKMPLIGLPKVKGRCAQCPAACQGWGLSGRVAVLSGAACLGAAYHKTARTQRLAHSKNRYAPERYPLCRPSRRPSCAAYRNRVACGSRVACKVDGCREPALLRVRGSPRTGRNSAKSRHAGTSG